MTQALFNLFVALILVLILIDNVAFSLVYKTVNGEKEKENSFWYAEAEAEIRAALKVAKNERIAKNIIFFLGDGMGVTVSTAGRIFKGQKKGFAGEEDCLTWEKFPNVGLVKTYTVDRQVTDSASAATAYLGGVKANYKTIGVNGNVAWKDCNASLVSNNKVDSILKWSQESGKETGYVTTTRLTHATPAGLYAHVASRDWECDTDMVNDIGQSDCKDIARQLVEDLPGKKINVILAGGRSKMGASLPIDGESSCRQDKRNLAKEWIADKEAAGKSSAYVTNTKELKQEGVENKDYILGLFSGSHMPYSYYRNATPEGTPSIKELTEVAIKRLQKSSNGYFLLVEGGRIDTALHDTKSRLALEDLVDFDDAVSAALNMTDRRDTLIIVTADHSHVMTINGYPARGNDILGTTTYEDVTDGLPYTTLMYTNGPGYNYSWNGEKVLRGDVSAVDTRDPDFIPQAAIPTLLGSETHGGEDVAVYASGPMSHLFHSLHEQSFIAHAMAYASCVGPFKLKCDKAKRIGKTFLDPLKILDLN